MQHLDNSEAVDVEAKEVKEDDDSAEAWRPTTRATPIFIG
jgi:hypothetical protein